jgi:type IV fimbrial biogenesis protein FimT
MSQLVRRGFTLVEMMVVLGITAMLMAMAVPQFQNFTMRRAAENHISTLASFIRLARSEAMSRGVPVSLCRSDAPEAAAPSCSAGAPATGWASGWLMFIDRGARGSVDASDVVLRVQPPIPNTGGVLANGGGAYVLTFERSGISLNNAQGFTVNPPLAPTHPNYAKLQRFMCIESSGRTRTTLDATCP